MVNQGIPVSVLQDYGLEGATVSTENFKGKKAVWYLRTSGQTRVMKKSPLSPPRLQFVLEAARYLRSRQVLTPEILPTRNGNLYATFADSAFYLTTFVAGRNPDYNNRKEMELVMQAMALFHRASTAFKPSPGSEPHRHLGAWPQEYARHLDDLSQITPAGTFGRQVMRDLPYILDMGQRALRLLETSAYSLWVDKVRQSGGLCHQDFAPGNLLIDAKGRIWVLDLDALTQEVPARDLRKILFKVAKRSKTWNNEPLRLLLAEYHRVNPLPEEYYAVLQIDLLFPHLYHGIVSKYVNGRAPEWSEEKFLHKLQQLGTLEQSKGAALTGGYQLLPG